MLVFKDIQGNRVDPLSHTIQKIESFPHVEIHIGSDSQNLGKKTIYCTVIAYRFGNRGVHYILSKSTQPVIRDMWSRLWKEAELSLEVAEWLTQQINIRVEIDMDYNDDENFKSNKLVSATKGWANSLGYKVNIKPFNQIVSKT